MRFTFTLDTLHGTRSESMDLRRLLVVGFAGRDIEKTMEHIRELEAEGISCPKTVPVVYECDPHIVTTSGDIRVIGDKTSGEVEYLILTSGDKTYIGIGSDHTDRALEATSIHKSKQVCLKPYSGVFWDYDEIKDHFDQIQLVASQVVDGMSVDYQEGVTADLLPLDRILEEVRKDTDPADSLIYTGTVPLKTGFQYGESFSCALRDPVLGRELSLDYNVTIIPEH